MAVSRLTETTIANIKEIYQLDWSTNDFLVSDEQNFLRIHDLPMHIDGYSIGICSRGTAKMEVNLNVYEGGANSMIITTPHQVLRVIQTSEDFLCRFIVFSKRFLAANYINPHILDTFQFSNVNAIPVVHLDVSEANQLKELFIYIWRRFQEVSHPFRKEITGNLLVVLLHDFEAIYQKHFQVVQKKLSRKEELNRQFHNLLFRHFKQERGVRFYADQMFVTPKYLTETVKYVTGKSAGEWIDAAVAVEAQALLKDPSLTIQQVGNLLNFPDQSTFGKFFKKEVGLSPSDYRHGANLQV
ncbi:helix-turn-helix domain-containing protein [Chitinophagaceae bacterium LB-8]|uniref:Helix-turn-helix domain-containing protein n=1 Tax=Paraflavisolibacter caeni TaxID=2982496 RepID=A0A9X3BA02_9BACT|nr:helix-turn-helix domain-containing protein [Paraflavisolibacter caeni]MCU7551991.1 helix-turn-helix domain-containing protein [Paraflavisolibacter caeni]